MQPQESTGYRIAHKWVSYCIVLAFAYYWLVILGYTFFNESLRTHMPFQTAVYRTFWKQKWRMFETPILYNRQLNLIIRDVNEPAKSDTIDLVQYSIAQKRKHAPFNNYQDALDRLLYETMNGLETQVRNKKALLQKQFPKQTEIFYMQQASMLVETDTVTKIYFQNLVAFGKHTLQLEKIKTTGKEFQLIIMHKYIPPLQPPAGSVSNGNKQTIFISAYRSL